MPEYIVEDLNCIIKLSFLEFSRLCLCCFSIVTGISRYN